MAEGGENRHVIATQQRKRNYAIFSGEDKMKNKVILVALCVMVITGLLVSMGACTTAASTAKTTSTSASSAAKTLKIGVIETLTGVSSDNLKLSAQGTELARDYINGKGGITVNGEKYLIELSIQDNNFNPERAAAAATSLISEEKVKFIVGTIPAFLTLSISAVTEPAGILYVPEYHFGLPAEYDPKTTKLKFYCNNGSVDSTDASLAACHKIWPDVKTLTTSQIDDGSIPLSQERIKAAATRNGFTITGDIIGIPPPSVDFTPIVQKLMASNPDAIMLGNGSIQMVGGQLKLLRESGYTKPVFLSTPNPIDDVVAVAGKDVATNFFSQDMRVKMTPEATTTMKELEALALKQYPRLGNVQVFGFNAVYMLAQAIEKAQSLDPAVVAASWEKMDTIDTGNGKGRMGGKEEYGIRHMVYVPVYFFTCEKGDIKYSMTVDPYKP
jgi:branched-chain amino acid transport system substrate-binding protein